MSAPPSFTCPRCGITSYSPTDAHEGYCGACHAWTGTGPRFPARAQDGLYYDLAGTPITAEQYARLRELKLESLRAGEEARFWQVRRDTVGEVFTVSTVWIGLDHSLGDGAPLIFETMVFLDRGADGPVKRQALDSLTRRYPDAESAAAGHAEVLAEVRCELRGLLALSAELGADAEPEPD